MPPYPPPSPTPVAPAGGPPACVSATLGVHPAAVCVWIQLCPLLAGQECPSPGRPLVAAALVQSAQVLVVPVPISTPVEVEPVSVSWLSGHALPVQPGAPSEWLRMPFSFGRSFMIAASPCGRVIIRPARFIATSRPIRSYQGPAPTRSIALTAPLPAPSVL